MPLGEPATTARRHRSRPLPLLLVGSVLLALVVTLAPATSGAAPAPGPDRTADRTAGSTADRAGARGPATGGTAYLPGDLPGGTSTGARGGAAREEVDPRSLDYPRMPQRCATFRQKVPLTPTTCKIRWTNEKRPTVVLWGDSHAWQFLPAVRKAIQGKKVNLVAFIFGGCVPAKPDMRIWKGQPCAETSARAIRFLDGLTKRGRDVRVVMGAYWGANLDQVYYYRNEGEKKTHADRRKYVLRYTVPLFRWLGKRDIRTDVLAMSPVVVPPNPDCQPGPTPYDCPIARRISLYKEAYVDRWVRQRVRDLPRGARYLDYQSQLCDAAVCRPHQAWGVYTWFDHYHLSQTTTERMSGMFAPTVTKLLARAKNRRR